MLRSLLGVVALALAACAVAPEPPALPGLRPLATLDAAQARGHDFAVRRCAGCHTVGLDDGGAGDGPTFRKLALRYNPISLERRFAQVSQHGFDRMPPVAFTPGEAADLIAYVNSLHGD
jgi:mono/diheme cytochrome c family protein